MRKKISMKKALFFVSNWKMYLSYQANVALYQQYEKQLASTITTTGHTLIVCPAVSALATITHTKSAPFYLSGQTCAAYSHGAYTGETDAQSLRELGCTYCIVGHSERRIYHHETDEIVAHQAQQLLNQGLIPIVCIGETREEKKSSQTHAVIARQLTAVTKVIHASTVPYLLVAYEPVWAIGSGQLPHQHEVESVFGFIRTLTHALNIPPIKLLYGGSINQSTVDYLKNTKNLDGFLVGKTSIDVAAYKAVIQACSW